MLTPALALKQAIARQSMAAVMYRPKGPDPSQKRVEALFAAAKQRVQDTPTCPIPANIAIHRVVVVADPISGGHRRDSRHVAGDDPFHKENRDFARSMQRHRVKHSLRDHRMGVDRA